MKRGMVEGKSIWSIILGFVVLLLYTGISPFANAVPQPPTGQKILLRWNLDSAPGDTLSLRAEKTKELMQADPEVRDLVKIELYYSNSLLKAPDAVEALIRGDIQMSFVGTWYFEKLSPNIIILDMPFL